MSLWPGIWAVGLRAATSQMVTVPSLPPDASVFPSRVKARQESVPLCPLSVAAATSGLAPARGSPTTDNVTRTEDATMRLMKGASPLGAAGDWRLGCRARGGRRYPSDSTSPSFRTQGRRKLVTALEGHA